MSGWPPAAGSASTWIITWRRCCASPARCRGDRAGAGPRGREVHPRHGAWWAAVRKAHGDAAGPALIEVLLLHRAVAHEHMVAGIAAALVTGALTADAVAVEARKAAQATQA